MDSQKIRHILLLSVQLLVDCPDCLAFLPNITHGTRFSKNRSSYGQPRNSEGYIKILLPICIHIACTITYMRPPGHMYMWTSWHSLERWQLRARSAYPEAIPWKRTITMVESVWKNLKEYPSILIFALEWTRM